MCTLYRLHMQLHSSALCIAVKQCVKEKLVLADRKPDMEAEFRYRYASRCCEATTCTSSEQEQECGTVLFLDHGFVLTAVPGCFHNIIVIVCIVYTHAFSSRSFFFSVVIESAGYARKRENMAGSLATRALV